MTTPTTSSTADDAGLKSKHRAMWATGDYAAVARDLIPDLGQALVDACDVHPGDRVLDVAAGTGNAAIPAARAGADVTASDLTPELLETGRRTASSLGVDLAWEEGDAEALPYADGSFDKVLSCVGVMFAPHHEQSADELVRVCRPEGTIGLLSWTPTGFVGQMFAAMKPWAPLPPPGASPPPLWGDVEHVKKLFGERAAVVEARTRTLRVTEFDRPEAFRDYFKAHYGPTIAVYRSIADDPVATADLDAALDDLGRRFAVGPGGTMEWEYLVVVLLKAS